MEIFFLLTLFVAMFSSWLIGRKVFSVMEKKQSKWANSVSLLVAMVSLVVIFVSVIIAISYGGAFRR
jgi:hypothetical protein